MTREIKFRAKIVMDIEPLAMKKGYWVEGYYYEDLQDGEWCSWIKECNDITHYKVDKNTLGQFTGLLDKNGDEICEGDVLAYTKYDRTKILLVEYKYGAFGYTYIDEFHALSGNPNFSFGTFGADADFEIVGNIHDSPELLKGGAE